DVVERGSGSGRQNELARLVKRDAHEMLGAHHHARPHPNTDLPSGAVPPPAPACPQRPTSYLDPRPLTSSGILACAASATRSEISREVAAAWKPRRRFPVTGAPALRGERPWRG